ncbi:MAG: sensor domain-containing diguanylate cyclase [Deltaproteobacteria bacterium]|nr:sensor domain-containing diguanylate cyclase [Deltaproteobacteria bacterium]MCL5277279.1 sensor domain-containing diguanylate cyclase [Deltaproteobacteria bacterium]
MTKPTPKQIAVTALLLVLLGIISSGYVLGIDASRDYTGILFLAFVVLLLTSSVIVYLLAQLYQHTKNVLLSLAIVSAYVVMLDYVESLFGFNAVSSLYLVFTFLTLVFGMTEGLIAVAYGLSLLTVKAYMFSRPLSRYVFYTLTSTLSVVSIGLILSYEKKIARRLQNKISTLEESPVEFDIKADNRTEPLRYSDIISEDGLKKERGRLTATLNERLYSTIGTIRSAIHPFTVALYLNDVDAHLKGREILSNSEWIDMERPVSRDDPYIGWVLKNKKSLLLNEINAEIKGIPYYTRNEGIKSFMAVPAIKDNAIIGVICADSLEVQAFTDEHVKLLTVITSEIIDLLDNTELQYRLRYDMYEKGAMYTFVRTLSRHIDPTIIGQISLKEIARITGVNAGIFAVRDEKKSFRVVAVSNISQTLIGKGFVADSTLLLDGLTDRQLPTIHQITASQLKLLYPSLYHVHGSERPFKYAAIIFLQTKIEEIGAIVLYMDTMLNERISIITDTLINQIAISLYNSILFNKLQRLAITDGLTGLHNHRHFQEHIENEIKEALRYKRSLTMLMMDIDRFKAINDTFGHPQGDVILKKISEIILQTIRDVDYAARYGGEEFCISLPNTDIKGAYRIAERLRKSIESLYVDSNGRGIRFTISIGISGVPEDAGSKDELISHADEALYFSKENGRNRTAVYGTIKPKE